MVITAQNRAIDDIVPGVGQVLWHGFGRRGKGRGALICGEDKLHIVIKPALQPGIVQIFPHT